MRKALSLAAAIALTAQVAAAGNDLPQTRTVSCEKIADRMGAPTRLKPSRSRPPGWLQVDTLMALLIPALQGQACAYRFEDLFKGLEDDEFVPLTNRLLGAVPAGTLQSLPVYDASGGVLGSFVRRVSHGPNEQLPESQAFFSFQYRSPDGRVESTHRRLLQGDALLKWADVKSKVAVDTTG